MERFRDVSKRLYYEICLWNVLETDRALQVKLPKEMPFDKGFLSNYQLNAASFFCKNPENRRGQNYLT